MNVEPGDIRAAREALEAEGFQVETSLVILEAGGVLAAWHPGRREGFILSPVEVRMLARYGKDYIKDGLVGLAKSKVPGPNYGETSRRYFEAALARITNEFREAAVQGNRNNALNKAAYAIGRFVGSGVITEEEAREITIGLGLGVGLPQHEVEATVKSGLEAGQKNPVEIPQASGHNKKKKGGKTSVWKG